MTKKICSDLRINHTIDGGNGIGEGSAIEGIEQTEYSLVSFRVGLQELMMALPLVDVPLLLRNSSEEEVIIEVVQ